MAGIKHPANKRGRKTAGAVNSGYHRRLWEDFHAELLAQRRKNEPHETLAQVHRKLAKAARLRRLAGAVLV